MKTPFLLLALSVVFLTPSLAQKPGEDPDPAYTRVIDERAGKIVAALGIADPDKAGRVRGIIAQQYRQIRAVHDPLEAKKTALKTAAPGDAKDAAEADLKAAQTEAAGTLKKLHGDFLARLSAELTPAQVDQVKDGMTYGIVQVTYKAYIEMYPQLTEEQKAKVMAFLVEARETAMDLGSSDEKHQWFGKYKGRINNYLSAAGVKAAPKKSPPPVTPGQPK